MSFWRRHREAVINDVSSNAMRTMNGVREARRVTVTTRTPVKEEASSEEADDGPAPQGECVGRGLPVGVWCEVVCGAQMYRVARPPPQRRSVDRPSLLMPAGARPCPRPSTAAP